MTSPRAILKKYNIRPYKKRGQSFLIDTNIIEKIVHSAAVTDRDVVVEIGAGIGVMTALLASHARRVIALEIDRNLIEVLHAELKDMSNIEIVGEDVLKYDFTSALDESPAGGETDTRFKVVGNIPYNISSQILFRMLRFREYVSSMTFMFQKEVADRIMASPGTKDYGLLSVLTSMYTTPEKVLVVPATCFYPRPKVESSVVRMRVLRNEQCTAVDFEFFFAVVKHAFAQRRKTLFNNLKASAIMKTADVDITDILNELQIDGHRRAETLSVEEFARLASALSLLQKS